MKRKKNLPKFSWRTIQETLRQIAGPDKSTAASTKTGYSEYQDFTRWHVPPEPPKKGE